ncbi:IQ calmodulin-binding motif protein (macronuclear) [Tetrahymena thermophila SB210]|uniref:IQ calmodulin-binding motif protein n=1 Tax=Tetrahymena thermophila (strain SB210) TaxID=312017 RepID=I7M6N3_TETTS|nr:IQ calmodulin-binding motif protein [Tetrahymena thermophila SB210]EAR85525.1 IQ calmodulin-binding motif protein [Tetrahymena thermophila SB210]|eukprot:XP_001033188.1 IQ calmodulin-binding motif protein [Tetrahymena thermophila SB210]
MKLTQEELKSIVLIQANIRGFLVRQEIRRQLLEIYEYEKEQLEYLQGQQIGQGEYYDYQYNLNRDAQENQSGKYITQSSHSEYEEQKKKAYNVKKSIGSKNLIQNDESQENIEFQKSSESSSSAEIEKKVQQKYMQQQISQRERQQAYEYQLHPVELNKQKTKEFQTDMNKNLNGACLVSGKNEAEALKFPQLHPIFSNSQMKMMMNSRDSQDEVNFQERVHQNQEKLKNIAEKLKKEEEEETDQLSQENLKIKLYSHSANYTRNQEESDDQEQGKEIQLYAQQKKEHVENTKNDKNKDNSRDSQMKYQKENHKEQDFLNQKSVNISVEISESNLLSERRQNLLPKSNYNNQNKIQKNSGKQAVNINPDQNGAFQSNKALQNGQNKMNPNRFYQDEEENYYKNQQINHYQQQKYQTYEQAGYNQNKQELNQLNNKFQNIIQVIDQFNYSPNSNQSSQNNIKESHFAKISNIEYNSYPCDQFLFEESQNYEIQQRFADDIYHQHHYHEHHPQLASYSLPQENNELIIDKSIYIKNMQVIKQMQDQQVGQDQQQRSVNHEKNMKKIRKMIHQNQILNNKNRKNFLQLSKYSLESFQSSQIFGEGSKQQIDSELEVNLLETTQQQKHNNGQIFDMSSKSNSMMSSRVPESQNQDSSKQLNNPKKSKTNNNNSSTRSEGTANSNTLVNSLNKKPIMFDFDIYILAATKIQKVFKGYLSRKLIIEFRQVKKAALTIEAQYLKFKQFLVKKMKDCNNQIECSSYNIIKLVQDFEKGEKFLKSQFRKKNFDQKIKVNRDKLCKVFIKFINTDQEDENYLQEGVKVTVEQENLILQKQVLKLKQYILQQQRTYKQELDQMQSKYEELRNLHKETIKKYITGIQNLKKRGSNQELTDSNLQESSQSYSNQNEKYPKSNNSNHQKLLQLYKEGDNDLNKLNSFNMKNKVENRNYYLTDQNNIQKIKKHGSSADSKRKSNKSPERIYFQKQFEVLTHEAEKDLEDFESQIKKIKYDFQSNNIKQSSTSNNSKKPDEKRQSKNKNESQNKEQLINKKCIQKQQQQTLKQSQNSIHQQYMSDEFANYNSKFSMKSHSKQ